MECISFIKKQVRFSLFFIFFVGTVFAEIRGVTTEKLHHAADTGNLTVVRNLLNAGVPVDLRDEYGYTPLYYAARMGHQDMANYLLDRGADINAQGKTGRTPLHGSFFYRGKSLEMINLLLGRGAEVDLPDGSGRTPLSFAISRKRLDVVTELIFQGADLHRRTNVGDTYLHQAVQTRSKEVIEYFLNTGIDLNWVNKYDRTALIDALAIGEDGPIHLILGAGANPNVGSFYDGLGALAYATLSGSVGLMKELLKFKADVNWVMRDGPSSLSWAIMAGDRERAMVLLDAGADVNIGKIRKKYSNFYGSVQLGNVEMVKLLVEAGADVNEVVSEPVQGSQTALDFAFHRGNYDLVRYLRSVGAKTLAELEEKQDQVVLPLAKNP